MVSETLAMNELVRDRLRAGEQIVHLAFGEAGLPAHPALVERVRERAPSNSYGPVAGARSLREAVAGHLERRRIESSPELVAVSPGSKAALFALVSSLSGDVVIPRPSWVSYAAQATLAGRRVLRVQIGSAGGLPDAAELERALDRAGGDGLEPGILILTVPDNPTGTVASADDVRRVLEIAVERGLAVISDEIYRDLAYDQDRLVTPGMCMPEEVIVTGGLSKALALGGWRIGFARLPDSPRGREACARMHELASEVWSCISSPLEEAATYAFSDPPELEQYVARARRLHQQVSEHVYALFLRHGARCRSPQAAFYLYPDLEALRTSSALGLRDADSAQLARLMLEELGIAVLPGAAFGDTPSALRFRVATSLLYGSSDDQRWQAIESATPTELPWIAGKLDQIDAGLAGLDAARR